MSLNSTDLNCVNSLQHNFIFGPKIFKYCGFLTVAKVIKVFQIVQFLDIANDFDFRKNEIFCESLSI